MLFYSDVHLRFDNCDQTNALHVVLFFSKRNQHNYATYYIGPTVIHNHLKIRFALILFKLHEIWYVDPEENH